MMEKKPPLYVSILRLRATLETARLHAQHEGIESVVGVLLDAREQVDDIVRRINEN